ncbi:hypothetical protein DBV15_08533, partial [Temnothorax longispinosus]
MHGLCAQHNEKEHAIYCVIQGSRYANRTNVTIIVVRLKGTRHDCTEKGTRGLSKLSIVSFHKMLLQALTYATRFHIIVFVVDKILSRLERIVADFTNKMAKREFIARLREVFSSLCNSSRNRPRSGMPFDLHRPLDDSRSRILGDPKKEKQPVESRKTNATLSGPTRRWIQIDEKHISCRLHRFQIYFVKDEINLRLRPNNEPTSNQHRSKRTGRRKSNSSSTDESFMIGSLLSRDCRMSDIEQRKERQKERNRAKIDQEGDERKGRKRTIKVTLHRAAASVLGRDGTAVSEGGEVGRQRKMEERKRGKKK